jgi:predicted AlkP superfamily pyrophosphatase or phosphodiesterase
MFRRSISAAFAIACLLGPQAALPSRALPPKPKLLLVIVVDQFRYDYLLRFRDGYKGGIARLLAGGANFADAHYPQFPAVTASGHATILTGATPSVSGIVDNEWVEREPFIAAKVSCPLASPPVSEKSPVNARVESISDDSTCLVGGSESRNGASPRRLLVSTLGDELKMAGRQSKVIGVSFKNRGAILTAGHMADAAYWFADGKFVTSSYYMPALPAWAEAFNKENPAAKYQNADWTPLELEHGSAFCSMAGAKEAGGSKVRGCEGIDATPFANTLLEEFAEKVIENEGLGTHPGTDILTVSFSANDILGHIVGPDAPEIRDISIRTDEAIGKLLSFIGTKLGSGAALTVFTADHGVSPSPKINNDRKMPGGWIDAAEVRRVIDEALSQRFGQANWLMPERSGLYIDYASEAAKNVSGAEIRRAAAEAAGKIPHIARVYTKDDLQRGSDQADFAGRAVALGFYASRSADIILLPDPYFMFGGRAASSYAGATTHVTPYNYDAHVPLILMGEGIKAGTYYDRVLINDLAPTLAALLEVEAPSGSSGRVLHEIFE